MNRRRMLCKWSDGSFCCVFLLPPVEMLKIIESLGACQCRANCEDDFAGCVFCRAFSSAIIAVNFEFICNFVMLFCGCYFHWKTNKWIVNNSYFMQAFWVHSHQKVNQIIAKRTGWFHVESLLPIRIYARPFLVHSCTHLVYNGDEIIGLEFWLWN